MPLYEFKCAACEHEQTMMLRVRDVTDVRLFENTPPEHRFVVVCSKCGEPGMERVPSAPSFKVTGFNAGNGYSRKD